MWTLSSPCDFKRRKTGLHNKGGLLLLLLLPPATPHFGTNSTNGCSPLALLPLPLMTTWRSPDSSWRKKEDNNTKSSSKQKPTLTMPSHYPCLTMNTAEC
eukprot:PhF_6_TR11600/c0_g1_i10/m.18804